MKAASASAALLALQLGVFVCIGMPDGALGVVWPGMRSSFHRATAELGFVLAANTVGYVLGSTSARRIASRLGTGRTVAAATAATAAALFLEVGAPFWALLLLGAAGVGLARGVNDANLNSHLAEHEGVRRLGLVHAAYGVGTTTSPLIATALLATGWRWAWGVIAVITAALAVWAWWARGRWPEAVHHDDPTLDGSDELWSAFGFAMTMVTFAVYVGAEYGTGSWAYVLLAEHRHMVHAAAGVVVAGFWGSLTASRLVLWRGGERLPKRVIVDLGGAMAFGGLLLAWANPGNAGWVGIPLAGFGMGPIFPTLVALTPDRLGVHRAAAAIGWSIAAAGVGGAALSALAGVLPLAQTLALYGALLLVSHAVLSAATQRRATHPQSNTTVRRP